MRVQVGYLDENEGVAKAGQTARIDWIQGPRSRLFAKRWKTPNPAFVQWRKSSYSGGGSGQGVEVGQGPGLVGLRDGKNPEVGHLAVERGVFAALAARVKAGELNL